MSNTVLVLSAGLLMGCSAVALTVAAAPDNKAVASAVLKQADQVGKKDWAALCKDGESIARKYDTDQLMYLLKPRNAKKNPGLGIGKTPGAIKPDGIEQKIQTLDKRVTAADVKHARDLERIAEITAAVASVIVHQTPEGLVAGEVKARLWQEWSEEMYKASIAFRDAARTKKAAKIKAAARRLNESCMNCHWTCGDW
jgi:hypothetical protein